MLLDKTLELLLVEVFLLRLGGAFLTMFLMIISITFSPKKIMMNPVNLNVREAMRQKSLIYSGDILTREASSKRKLITFLTERAGAASCCDQSRASSATTPLFHLSEIPLWQTMTNSWLVNHTAVFQHAYQKAFSC